MFPGLSVAGCAQTGRVRQAAVAGSFYPADPKELAAIVDGFLAKAPPPPEGEVIAVVAPHAGYIYSGAVAGCSYATVKGKKFERVVVISPSHIDSFGFASVYDGSAYATPLGEIQVDTDFASRLTKAGANIKFSSRGHVPAFGRSEHALEVQLPFLQRALDKFRLVPIIMGAQHYDLCRELGVVLSKSIAGSSTLIVASSDLSHFHPYDQASSMDRKTLKAIADWDYLTLSRNFEHRVWEACGGGPIIAAMMAAERLGADTARVLKYANSGDVTRDHSSVVGYGSVVMLKTGKKRAGAEVPFTLTPEEKRALLHIARTAVEMAVRDKKRFESSDGGHEALARELGAFVTLKKRGELRGCIGHITPIKPLHETVRDVAILAALEDHRFSPVRPEELPELEYEISVLSPMRRVLDPNEIEIGRDGLVIKRGRSEGLLLPQVPLEQHWDRLTFLAFTCRKAGLDSNAWKDPSTDIFRFTALVFNDHDTLARPS